jgi:predicted site-specific integrase-resolvase
MTNEKQLRMALYARVPTTNGRQDTENRLQQLQQVVPVSSEARPDLVISRTGHHRAKG